MKRAKEEAVHEVEAFKAEKEKHYKSLEQQVMCLWKSIEDYERPFSLTALLGKTLGSRSTNEDSIKNRTDQMIREMQSQYETNKATVLKHILDAVCTINAQKHENLIIA